MTENNATKISAGSYDLNKWLFGGYDRDTITTIYGPAGCGKTNFCMLVAVSQAKKGNKVIFIDTEGGFSLERVKQLAGEEHETAMKNIILFKPTNFEEQEKAFSDLLKKLANAGLIVVDGMTMLYRLELAEAIKKSEEDVRRINSKLARQLRMLAEISRKKSIPVIITNQVYTNFSDEKKEKEIHMVGGDILKYWSKCIIEIKNEKGKRTAFLRKHRSLPEKEFPFVIVNEGIRKRGLF